MHANLYAFGCSCSQPCLRSRNKILLFYRDVKIDTVPMCTWVLSAQLFCSSSSQQLEPCCPELINSQGAFVKLNQLTQVRECTWKNDFRCLPTQPACGVGDICLNNVFGFPTSLPSPESHSESLSERYVMVRVLPTICQVDHQSPTHSKLPTLPQSSSLALILALLALCKVLWNIHWKGVCWVESQIVPERIWFCQKRPH